MKAVPRQLSTLEMRLERGSEEADGWKYHVDYEKAALGGLHFSNVQNIPISHGYTK
jgi:hypothetical protein